MVVGLIGAVMTAAYMTRCVYLTFFGKYRGHHHPHESSPAITVPLIILAVLSLLAGLLQAVPFDIKKFETWLEPVGGCPDLVHPTFDYRLATISVALASMAIGAMFVLPVPTGGVGRVQGPHASATSWPGRATASWRRSTTSTTCTRA